MLDKNEVYVYHIGVDIELVGSKAECILFKNSRPYDTSNWNVNTLEDYGYWCYEEGNDNGFASGIQQKP